MPGLTDDRAVIAGTGGHVAREARAQVHPRSRAGSEVAAARVVVHEREEVGHQVGVLEIAVAQQVPVGMPHEHLALDAREPAERVAREPHEPEALLQAAQVEVGVVDLGEAEEAHAPVQAPRPVDVGDARVEVVPEAAAVAVAVAGEVEEDLLVAEQVAERDLPAAGGAAE